MNTHHTNPHRSVFPSPDGDREETFFSRDDQAISQGPRVSLYARISDNPKAPRFDGVIGDVPVALFLRQPAGRSPFLSIVGALGTPRAKENLGTARVVTSPSGAPRLLVYLSAPIDGVSPAAPAAPEGSPVEQRLFVSISKSLDQRVLLELGLDEHRQKAKRAAWEASRVKVVRPQDLEPDSPPKD